MTDNRVILVTGANKGIGYEAVKLLSEKLPNGKIILTTRSLANGESALSKMRGSATSSSSAAAKHDYANVSLLQLEITDSKSLAAAVQQVKRDFGRLDALVHNSAVSSVDGDPHAAAILDTNVRGAHDTVEAFAPLIPRDGTGRIIVVSSEVGAWVTQAVNPTLQAKLNDPATMTYENIQHLSADWLAFARGQEHEQEWPPLSPMNGGYTVSKALLSAWLRSYALAAQQQDIKVAIVCPGYCATDLNGNSGFRSAAQGAESITWPLFNDFETGHFYQDGKELEFIQAMPDMYKKAFEKQEH